MRRRALLWAAVSFTAAFATPRIVHAVGDGLDLARYARLDVSGIRGADPFGVVSDYEKKGPPAVRDQDETTGWAVPAKGEQHLLLDFTEFAPLGFRPDKVVIRWSRPPQHGCRLWTGSDPALLELKASAGAERMTHFELAGSEVMYMKVSVPDPGPDVDLDEIQVFGHGRGSPRPLAISWNTDRRGVLALHWGALDKTRIHHVEIHRSMDSGFKPSPSSLIAVCNGTGTRLLPPRQPGPAGFEVAVVSVGFGGERVQSAPRVVQSVPGRPDPAWPLRGVVEGFYGRPWPRLHRLAMFKAMAQAGMNFYAYAPKNDPGHRQEWKARLSLHQRERFVEMLSSGARHGIDVAFTISPGLSLEPDSSKDMQLLEQKVAIMADIGFKSFGLLLDDIPKRPDKSLGVSHAMVVRRLKRFITEKAGKNAFLFFVPTVYSGRVQSLEPDERDYLSALSMVPADVPVAWTGPKVFSRHITSRDVAELRELLGGRQVMIWDNYPVNDAGKKDLHLGAVMGRSRDLVGLVRGFLVNPMIEAAASRIPVRAYADFLYYPEGYDAGSSYSRALSAELGDREWTCLSTLASFYTGSSRIPTHAPDSSELERSVESFLNADTGSAVAVEAALKILKHLYRAWRAETCLKNAGLPIDMVDDLEPAAITVSRVAAGTIPAVLALSGAATGGDPGADARKLLQDLDAASWGGGFDPLVRILKRVASNKWSGDERSGKGRSALSFELPRRIRVGVPISLEALPARSGEHCRTYLEGPDGASLEHGRLQWTPKAAGRYRIGLVARCGSRLAAAGRELVVVPGPDSEPELETGKTASAVGGLVALVLLAWLAAKFGKALVRAKR